MSTEYYVKWSSIDVRSFLRCWYAKPENRDTPAATETEESIAWEQVADVFTAR